MGHIWVHILAHILFFVNTVMTSLIVQPLTFKQCQLTIYDNKANNQS